MVSTTELRQISLQPSPPAGKGTCVQHKDSAEGVIQANRQSDSNKRILLFLLA